MIRLISIATIIGIALMGIFAEVELYSDKYDDIDIINILNNDKLRDQHRKCYMGKGPCPTADMKFYKEIIGEALVTKCKRCTEKQKQNLDKLTEWYTTNRPEEWEEFVATLIVNMKKENGEQ
ncbi:PREDICTED: putative odorant-binding protein A10 [Dinoponera quadriceps]|uniref:Odorant-binding protein A10 n=1 Tax=Dinoponera quadriceps TaxID=609295 RepID=A0A6P3XX32_DINQU|nr:PREDICTED: putative odorant-binding protein A10 [Dinoponera quadriceps]